MHHEKPVLVWVAVVRLITFALLGRREEEEVVVAAAGEAKDFFSALSSHLLFVALELASVEALELKCRTYQ